MTPLRARRNASAKRWPPSASSRLLPVDQARELRALWEEFEARQSPEARYAAALDRIQPVLLNFHTQGVSWREHDVTRAQVIARNGHIAAGAPRLWEYVEGLIEEATARGWLRDDRRDTAPAS